MPGTRISPGCRRSFFGLKPAVLAIVLEAVLRIGKKALKTRLMVVIAALAFIAIFFYDVPFPVIILSAAIIGFTGGRFWPDAFAAAKAKSTACRCMQRSRLWMRF